MDKPLDRLACLQAIFGNFTGAEIAKRTDAELLALAHDERVGMKELFGPTDRRKLAAILRLAHLWRGACWLEPLFLRVEADVVAHVARRCATLAERTIWILAVDPDGSLACEALVAQGGDERMLPSRRSLLRHAIRLAAVGVWVVEFQPRWRPLVSHDLRDLCSSLHSVAEASGIVLHGWVVLARDGSTVVASEHAGVTRHGAAFEAA